MLQNIIIIFLILLPSSPRSVSSDDIFEEYCQNIKETLPADEVERELRANNLHCL